MGRLPTEAALVPTNDGLEVAPSFGIAAHALEVGAVLIVNENDPGAVDELAKTFGDNDGLAALMTNVVQAQLLVILSDVDGLYDGDPTQAGAKIVPTVAVIDESIHALVRDKKSGLSKGGMASKLEAARIATTAGENVVIAPGRGESTLVDVAAGKNVGTLFLAQGKTISPFKRWIGFSAQTQGAIIVDAGAARAIVTEGRSLLAIGISEVSGSFEKGDVVAICDSNGLEVARGLTNYSAADVLRIKGLKSDEIANALGHRPYEEVIHRDNLVVIDR